MGMTITQKILAAHAGREAVVVGEIVKVDVDLVMSHDLNTPPVLAVLKELGMPPVFDREKVAIVMEHVVPSHSVAHANLCEKIRRWAREQQLVHFYDMGRSGIAHAFLPEIGLVRPEQLILGADSHSCTMGCVGAFATGVGATDAAVAIATGESWLKVPGAIRIELTGQPRPWISAKDVMLAVMGIVGADGALYATLEFTGEGVRHIDMSGRASMCSMAVEAGAKNGIFAPDEVTLRYLRDRPLLAGLAPQALRSDLASDADAEYLRTVHIDLGTIDFLVAAPPSPANVKPLQECGNVKIDQVFLGTCTNGRIEDLRVAAEILRGQRVARDVRMIVVPATQQVMIDAAREGLLETLMTAGAVIGTPGCGPCHALHMGPLADGEVGLYTANRNFPGRQGSPKAVAYLASPAVAAATAIAGRIASPFEVRPELATGPSVVSA